MNEALSFEAALKRLEEVVARLEQGEIALEEMLALFEEGVKLSRFCRKKLDEAEKKIEVLLQDDKGAFRREPYFQAERGDSEG
jgi:exodeoxyribonuclease VII small subunit